MNCEFYKCLSMGEDIKNLAMSLINSLGICSFRLTKLLSNSHVLSSLPPSELSPKIFNLDLSSQSTERALVMSWDIEHDTFISKPTEKNMPVTKRGILGLVSFIFYSLSILTPSLSAAKLIIQYLWRKTIDWEESIPEDLVKYWKGWLDNLLEI